MKLPDGFLAIDKPAGKTSHDMVDLVRKKTGEKRVGHAGTLDPFATGLLIIGVGREHTKKLDQFKGMDKIYEATAVLGATSTTGDLTGDIAAGDPSAAPPAEASLRMTLEDFIGEQTQIPPMYSAKKVGGKKLYELARKGETIERQPHAFTVYKIDVLRYNYPELVLEISCSSGTYIRTLVEDIAKALGCTAYAKELRRIAIGEYVVKDALSLA